MSGRMLHDQDDEPTVSAIEIGRRDFARAGLVGGAALWATPHISTIRVAQRLVGSVRPPSTTTNPPPTTSPPPGSTTTTVPGGTTTTTAPPGSTTTTVPGGTTTTVPGGTTTTLPGGTTTTVGPVGSTTTSSSPPTTPTTRRFPPNNDNCALPNPDKDNNPDNPANQNCPPNANPPIGGLGGTPQGPSVRSPGDGVLGPLAFTGSDTLDLAVLGATSVVLGRGLFAVARRRRDDDQPPDAVDGAPAPT
jgi:hypothetical protein